MNKSLVQRILAFPFSGRQSALSKSRPSLSASDFVGLIRDSGGDVEAAKIIHSKLQDWIYHQSFTPYPGDSLASVFGIAEEELDEDLILDVFSILELATPSEPELKAFGVIDTATDIARLVALTRSIEQPSAT
ncbi:MAG TPA: hypothetical protein VN640_06320 [Sphingomicrobium sp.]|jgi:hypothetical protein|nr:hypothetical protein [Sphingomicrobium sp.]